MMKTWPAKPFIRPAEVDDQFTQPEERKRVTISDDMIRQIFWKIQDRKGSYMDFANELLAYCGVER